MATVVEGKRGEKVREVHMKPGERWTQKKYDEMNERFQKQALEQSLKVTLPWVADEFEATQKLMGDNFWRYGFEANRKELELVMRYVHA